MWKVRGSSPFMSTKLTQYEPSGWEKSRGIFIALSQALQRIRSFSLNKKTLFINVSTMYWQNFISFMFPFLNLSKKNFACANSSFGFKIFSFCLFSIWVEITSTVLPTSSAKKLKKINKDEREVDWRWNNTVKIRSTMVKIFTMLSSAYF